jgi:voltage-gated potassium channel Kch
VAGTFLLRGGWALNTQHRGPMRKITTSDRLRYQFDNTMSRGTSALIGWLALISLVLVVAFALIIALTGIAPAEDGPRPGFGTLLWLSLMHTMDSGMLGGDGGSPAYLFAMLGVTLGGIFIVSTLIGVLSNGIAARFEDLRKGRSFVVESDHTIILGWSTQIFSIISELALANANRRGACIAILAERDKVEMEDEIRAKVGPISRTRIVCRSGNPADIADLDMVNPHTARSIIVLAPETPNPDSSVIKTLLALTNHPHRRKTPYHIVAELHDPQNSDVARMVGRDEVELVLVGDLIARITVQTCQQSGLSVVYTELLDFGGHEIYFHEEPALAGKTFADALVAYEDSTPIGIQTRDGKVRLNPPSDQRLETGDKLIAISEDDDTIRLSRSGPPTIDTAAIAEPRPRVKIPDRTLILGWNRRAPIILKELHAYVAPGSQVTVIADNVDGQSVEYDRGPSNLTISLQEGDTTERRLLDSLDVPAYNHVIVLSSEELEPQEADARTLITLLHLRDIAERTKRKFSIVSEMLDIRNRDLAEVTQADDFIVSDKLVGLMLSQVSEHKHLAAVFADLFDPEGAEIYLKPADDYIEPGRPTNFYTVVEAARRRGEVAIGYRFNAQADDAAHAYGVRVNPRKPDVLTLSADDSVIVLADS